MNESICLRCSRYGGRYSSSQWLCARIIFDDDSEVIPGYEFLQQDAFCLCSCQRKNPPEYCPYILEHVVAEEEKNYTEGSKRLFTRLNYNGNQRAAEKKYFLTRMLKHLKEKGDD